MKKIDVLLTALVLAATKQRIKPGQIRLSAEAVEEARQRVAIGGSVLIDEKTDGSIVIGVARKRDQSRPSSSSLE